MNTRNLLVRSWVLLAMLTAGAACERSPALERTAMSEDSVDHAVSPIGQRESPMIEEPTPPEDSGAAAMLQDADTIGRRSAQNASQPTPMPTEPRRNE